MITKSITEALFPRTRQLLLGELVKAEGDGIHVQEFARRTGKDVALVSRELRNLEAAGIASSQRVGNQVQYSLNPQCPIYPELRMLIIKTVGLADVLREALKPLAKKIRVAFIYGSFSRGEERADSDVDVLVIGDVSFGDVVHATYGSQETLRREVNPSVYPVAEYLEKLAAGHHFIEEVLKGEKIFLIGDANDLADLVQ